MMSRVLVLANMVISACLLFYVFSLHKKVSLLTPPYGVIRAGRFEVVDKDGRVSALLGFRGEQDREPWLVLFDHTGRSVIETGIDEKGNGTLYFSNRRIDGKVAVGYLRGSDVPIPESEDDPLGTYGIRVLGPNGAQLRFGLDMSGKPLPVP